MSDTTKKNLVNDAPFYWGADQIGRAIGLTKRQAVHLLENNRLPAKKVGGRWVASRAELMACLSTTNG